MPNAKDTFLERIKYLRKSLSIETLNDKPPTHQEHNNIAKLLRNGMAVVGFVSLEDFIKKRSGEILSEIGRCSVPFNALPSKIRHSATVDVLNALIKVVKNISTDEDQIAFIQNEANKIASTNSTSYDLTEYAFANKSSNVNAEEIKTILRSFHINDPWRNMSAISSRIGLTSFPLDNSFKNAADRRHRAAHVAHSNTPINDLDQYIAEAYGIAIGFDSLITKALNLIKNYDLGFLGGTTTIDHNYVRLSFIKKDGAVWKYKKEGVDRAIKVNGDRVVLLSYAISKAQSSGEALVIFDESNVVENWICY